MQIPFTSHGTRAAILQHHYHMDLLQKLEFEISITWEEYYIPTIYNAVNIETTICIKDAEITVNKYIAQEHHL